MYGFTYKLTIFISAANSVLKSWTHLSWQDNYDRTHVSWTKW